MFLVFEKTGSKILFNVVSGLFSTVAKVYDILLRLVEDGGNLDSFTLNDIMTAMYVLAGVFMVFRVTVSFLQMLVNPDLVSDSKAGSSKVISRVVISVIMLLLFVPNGLLFGDQGLFKRVERALLADDGLITNIMPKQIYEGASDYSNINYKKRAVSSSNMKDNFFIENVYAKGNKLNCYYYRISDIGYQQGNASVKTIKIDKLYKISFYSDNAEKRVKLGGSNVYYYQHTGRVGGDKYYEDENGNIAMYSQLGYSLVAGSTTDFARNRWPNSCPYHITWKDDKWVTKDGGRQVNTTEKGLHGGYQSLNGLLNALKKVRDSGKEGNAVLTLNPAVDAATETQGEKSDQGFLSGVKHPSAVSFAQSTASTFQECEQKKEEDCNNAQAEMFKTQDGNDQVIELMAEDDLHLDFVMSLVAGVGLIVYLLYLCIEVIVRKFKLMLLEMIAPLPIVAYVNPKDETFNKWIKMYFSTYLSLFVMLVSISIALNMLINIDQFLNSAEHLLKFFYIVGILLFAKLIPKMIEDIFGLKGMGGSFKDIMGMAKSVAGAGIGGALGAGVGFLTGKGLGRISGALGGAMRGVGSGSKGTLSGVAGGAKSISDYNKREKQGEDRGLNWFARRAADVKNAVGIPENMRDNRKIDKINDNIQMMDDFKKHKDNIEEMAEKFSPLADLKNQYNMGKLSKDEYKAARKEVIRAAKEGRAAELIYFDEDGKLAKDAEGNLMTKSYALSDGDRSKINNAVNEMKETYANNSALRSELLVQRNRQTVAQTVANANYGGDITAVTNEEIDKLINDDAWLSSNNITLETTAAATISDFDDYSDYESVATFAKNADSRTVSRIKQSDSYRKGATREAFAKGTSGGNDK